MIQRGGRREQTFFEDGDIDARLQVTARLWHGWFSSVAMDEAHLISALHYVALIPVWARAEALEKSAAGEGSGSRLWNFRNAGPTEIALVQPNRLTLGVIDVYQPHANPPGHGR